MGKMSRRRSEQTWRDFVAQQVGSGLSVQAFCGREHLDVNTFYGWRLLTGIEIRLFLVIGKRPTGHCMDHWRAC